MTVVGNGQYVNPKFEDGDRVRLTEPSWAQGATGTVGKFPPGLKPPTTLHEAMLPRIAQSTSQEGRRFYWIILDDPRVDQETGALCAAICVHASALAEIP